MAVKRSYGTGALFERADSAGRVSWYGPRYQIGPRYHLRYQHKRISGDLSEARAPD